MTIEQSSFRSQGDDAVALWSETDADRSNRVQNNLVQLPNLANGIGECDAMIVHGGRQPLARPMWDDGAP